jgi:hypothetical protein
MGTNRLRRGSAQALGDVRPDFYAFRGVEGSFLVEVSGGVARVMCRWFLVVRSPLALHGVRATADVPHLSDHYPGDIQPSALSRRTLHVYADRKSPREGNGIEENAQSLSSRAGPGGMGCARRGWGGAPVGRVGVSRMT